jgi:RHH-type proline utilization regulon transcriptional repressor/proline dehydrogenase/delta 1-pyrroline-5-carboxylate dehydrogenase
LPTPPWLEDLVKTRWLPCCKQPQTEGAAGLPHPRIPLPVRLYGSERNNSQGLDLANEQVLTDLSTTLRQSALQPWHAGPLLAQDTAPGTTQPVRNPADHQDVVGQVQEATLAEVDQALAWASAAAAPWAATPRPSAPTPCCAPPTCWKRACPSCWAC